MANPGWSKVKYAARVFHLVQDAAGRLLEAAGEVTHISGAEREKERRR